MPAAREMTLQEVVDRLPQSHSARREYEQLVSQDIEEGEASDPIDMGRAEMRVEILRLRDVVDLLREQLE